MSNFQRIGSVSNSNVGRDFELLVAKFFTDLGLNLVLNLPVEVGIGDKKKVHRFDIGSKNERVIIECKSHKWTSGNNVPSAKLTTWNEAMYYFVIAPDSYRKLFVVLKDVRSNNKETLAEYYIRRYDHMIPESVEIWEFDVNTIAAIKLK